MGKVINRNNIVEGMAILSSCAVGIGAVHSLGEAVFALSMDRDSSLTRQAVEHIAASVLMMPGAVLLGCGVYNAVGKLKK